MVTEQRPIIVMEDQRIRLALTQERHAAALARLWNDSRVMERVGFPRGLGVSTEQVASIIRNQRDNWPAGDYHLSVELADGTFIGEAIIGRTDDGGTSHPDIKLLHEYWRQGYARESMHLVIGHIFTHTHAARVRFMPAVDNHAAIKLYSSFGCVPDGAVQTWHPATYMDLNAPEIVSYQYQPMVMSREVWDQRYGQEYQ